MKRILIICLSALGDFVMSFAPFAAIRAHHPEGKITLVTTAPLAVLAMTAEDRAMLGAQARAAVEAQYTVRAMQEATIQVYREVLLGAGEVLPG